MAHQHKKCWILSVEDPSGETRRFRFSGDSWVGRSPDAPICLRDPTLPSRALNLFQASENELWLRSEPGAPEPELADLRVREARLPEGIPVRLGETRLTLESRESRDTPLPPTPRGLRPWLTQSDSGRQLLWSTHRAAATPLSIYLAGETGTGKEVLAQLIHSWSTRASGNFVPLNCAALSLSIVESELFGHTKGAFTGANRPRPGALLQAHNGTLFLDEVGDLPHDIQVKLLRFLENGELRAVGSDQVSHANVRLICATHKPLLKLVEEGKFRRDLYFRLASVTLEIPKLHDRPEDISLIATRTAADLDRSLSPRALLKLQRYSWPGNVRELIHAIERASALSPSEGRMLPEDAFDFLLDHSTASPTRDSAYSSPIVSLEEAERHLLLRALRHTRGNRTQAARLLGISRSTIFEKIKRHRIVGPLQRDPDFSAPQTA